MDNLNLLLTSSNGSLYKYNLVSTEFMELYRSPQDNEYFKGITRDKDNIYFASNYRLFTYNRKTNSGIRIMDGPENNTNPVINHIKCIGNYIFVTCSAFNYIVVVHKDNLTDILYQFEFASTKLQTNCDNIVDLFYDDTNFFVQFSDVSDDKGSSLGGIVVFDKTLDIKLRATSGKNVSCISFIGNKLYTVCNGESGGLFVDGLKMIRWNSEYEIYDIAVDREYIYLVGKVYYRKNRSSVLGGVIYKFDRNFNKIDVDVITHVGIFLGCMLETYDLTNSMYNYNLDINTIPEKKEGYLKVIKHDTVQ